MIVPAGKKPTKGHWLNRHHVGAVIAAMLWFELLTVFSMASHFSPAAMWPVVCLEVGSCVSTFLVSSFLMHIEAYAMMFDWNHAGPDKGNYGERCSKCAKRLVWVAVALAVGSFIADPWSPPATPKFTVGMAMCSATLLPLGAFIVCQLERLRWEKDRNGPSTW